MKTCAKKELRCLTWSLFGLRWVTSYSLQLPFDNVQWSISYQKDLDDGSGTEGDIDPSEIDSWHYFLLYTDEGVFTERFIVCMWRPDPTFCLGTTVYKWEDGSKPTVHASYLLGKVRHRYRPSFRWVIFTQDKLLIVRRLRFTTKPIPKLVAKFCISAKRRYRSPDDQLLFCFTSSPLTIANRLFHYIQLSRGDLANLNKGLQEIFVAQRGTTPSFCRQGQKHRRRNLDYQNGFSLQIVRATYSSSTI
jgi:hypothetical protein